MADETKNSSQTHSPYTGRWVALVHGKVVAQGGTPEQALRASQHSRYKEKPEIIFMPASFMLPPLLEKILDGSIPMEEVPEMTPQKLFPDHWKALQDKQKAQDEFLYLKKPEAATDEFKCSKCKQRKCTYYELQTRSIDEPMTKFIRCLVCENRWRMSA